MVAPGTAQKPPPLSPQPTSRASSSVRSRRRLGFVLLGGIVVLAVVVQIFRPHEAPRIQRSHRKAGAFRFDRPPAAVTPKSIPLPPAGAIPEPTPLPPAGATPDPIPLATPPESLPSAQTDGNAAPPSTFAQASASPSTVPAGAKSVAGRKPDKNHGDDVFTDGVIPRISLEIPDGAWRGLQRSPRQYIRATVREGHQIYTNVALHLKGSAGSFRPIDDTPSYTLNFDKFAPEQRFHGLKKLHLNRSIQDHSYLSEMLGRELFNSAGVPTPRAGHALVSVNGERPQLHVLIEGVNHQFLKRHFTDVTGNVYDGHSQRDVTDRLPTNDGDTPADQTRLRALAAAAREGNLQQRRTRLEATLDVNRFLTFMALELILAHWDGYVLNKNNFRIFHDRSTDRLVFLPHGMDQLLNRSDISVLRPHTVGLVATSVLEVPEFRQRYQDRVMELMTNIVQLGPRRTHLQEVAGRIDRVLSEINPEEASAHQKRAVAFERHFQQRVQNLERQLSLVPPPSFSGTNGWASFDWQPRVDLGTAQLVRENGAAGKPLLTITTTEGCTASWRSRTHLPRGRYALEGSLRTRHVLLDPADSRAGAGLRISRQRALPKNEGDREWTPINCEFQVQDEDTDVELICELRAREGTVWFDPGAFKLRKL